MHNYLVSASFALCAHILFVAMLTKLEKNKIKETQFSYVLVLDESIAGLDEDGNPVPPSVIDVQNPGNKCGGEAVWVHPWLLQIAANSRLAVFGDAGLVLPQAEVLETWRPH